MTDIKDPFDPKLRTAMDEIKAILRKYDIAGEVQLCSETHSEYLHQIFGPNPSWSCIHLEDGGIRIMVKAKTGGDSERRRAEATIHMVHQFRDLHADSFAIHHKLVATLHEHFDIEVGERRHTPYEGNQ